jgi:hypothetical protein
MFRLLIEVDNNKHMMSNHPLTYMPISFYDKILLIIESNQCRNYTMSNHNSIIGTLA